MGCHSWFARPLTDDEVEKLTEYCQIDIEDKRSKEGYDEQFLNLISESAKTNAPFRDPTSPSKRLFWWFQFGYGEDYMNAVEREPYLLSDDPFWPNEKGIHVTIEHKKDLTERKTKHSYELYADIKLHNVARLRYTYPRKIIHNKRELRRFLGKDYFKISEREHQLLSEFWKTFPGGIMSFG
jgi:hypothetical protein